jgi:hypothetical protein
LDGRGRDCRLGRVVPMVLAARVLAGRLEHPGDA